MATVPRRSLLFLAFAAYVSLGLPDAINGVAWPVIRHEFDEPISAIWMLLATSTVGYLIASFTASTLMRRLGVGGILVASSGCIVLGMAGYALSPMWGVMASFGLLAGLGAGAIDAAMNLYAATHFRPRLVTWMHGCWGVGATIGPLIMTFAIARLSNAPTDAMPADMTSASGWRWGYTIIGGIIAVMLVGFVVTRKRWDDGATASTDPADVHTEPIGLWDALRRGRVWTGIAVFFVYTGLEAAIGTWTPSLLREGRGFDESPTGTAIAIYWFSLTAGRMVIGWLTDHVPVWLILRVATITAPLAILLIWFSSNYYVNVAGLALLGFVLAPMYPLWITQTPIRLGKPLSTHGIGFQVSAAYLGMTLIPATLGFLIRYAGFKVTGPTLFAVAACVWVVAEIAHKQTPAEITPRA